MASPVVASAVMRGPASRKNEQPAHGARLLDCGAHEGLEQLFQDDVTRYCLRHFDDGGEIQMFNRGFDCTRQTRHALVQSQPRMELIELPHLSVRSPAQIALPRVSEMSVGAGF